MPNWIVGTFKVRGNKENITLFVTDALRGTWSDGEDRKSTLNEEYSDAGDLFFDVHEDTLWLVDTNRQFVEPDGEIHAFNFQGKDFICAMPFRGAWGIRTEEMVELAKRYHVDIKVDGFEQGMGFEQHVEVDRKGNVLKDIDENYGHDYATYVWECPMPLLGG